VFGNADRGLRQGSATAGAAGAADEGKEGKATLYTCDLSVFSFSACGARGPAVANRRNPLKPPIHAVARTVARNANAHGASTAQLHF
jgi:hypothetical protein